MKLWVLSKINHLPIELFFFFSVLKIHSTFFFVLSSRLADVYCPILILHDRSDEIISFALGKKVGNGDRIYQSEKYDLPRNGINKKLWLCDSEDRGAQMVSWRPRFEACRSLQKPVEACRSLQKPEVLQASLLSLQ